MEQGVLPVGQIKLGMHILRADGRVGVVTGWKVVPGTKVMYNLEVAQEHTFMVDAGQWVVHNDCLNGSGNPGQLRGKSREQYVRTNLNSIFGTDMGTPGPSMEITTTLGHTDVDIPTDTSLIEVAGQGHVSSDAQLSRFYNKMQKYNAMQILPKEEVGLSLLHLMTVQVGCPSSTKQFVFMGDNNCGVHLAWTIGLYDLNVERSHSCWSLS